MIGKNIKRSDLIKSIYLNVGFSKVISENLVNDIFDLLIKNTIEFNTVKISKFGNFVKRNKKERLGRNPKTKEVKTISSRQVIVFKPSMELKKIIND